MSNPFLQKKSTDSQAKPEEAKANHNPFTTGASSGFQMGAPKSEIKLGSLGLTTQEHQFKKKDSFGNFGKAMKKDSSESGPVFGAGGDLFAKKSVDNQ